MAGFDGDDPRDAWNAVAGQVWGLADVGGSRGLFERQGRTFEGVFTSRDVVEPERRLLLSATAQERPQCIDVLRLVATGDVGEPAEFAPKHVGGDRLFVEPQLRILEREQEIQQANILFRRGLGGGRSIGRPGETNERNSAGGEQRPPQER